MVHEFIMTAIEGALKDWGLDWMLKEAGYEFKGLMEEIELALSKVI